MPISQLTSGKTDWETPQWLYEKLDAEFSFTVDVCATAANAKHRRHWTASENGLRQDWSRDVCWMNPPYGRALPIWVRKAEHQARRGATVVALLPARTNAGWWHALPADAEIRFIRGRVAFVGARHPAPFPLAVVVFRPAAMNAARGKGE